MTDKSETHDSGETGGESRSPSLFDALISAWPMRGWRPGRIAFALGWALVVGLAVFAAVALLQTRAARSEVDGDRASDRFTIGADLGATRFDDEAKAGELPPMAMVLDELATRLPPGLKLAAAERDEQGFMMITIIVADPDILREATRPGGRLAGLRMLRQDSGGDGSFRVTLTGKFP